MINVSVTASATTISINNLTTKTFVGTDTIASYIKTLIQFHRWYSTPPQFIYLDLHGSTSSNIHATTTGRMVVYGVLGYIANVEPSVCDTAFVIENGKMLMETDVDMNANHIKGTVHLLHGILNRNNGQRLSINGCDKLIIPNDKEGSF